MRRADRLAADNAMSLEERERRAGAAAEATAHVDAVAAALRAAELDLEFTRVVSPIDGRVSRALVTRGNLVSGGQGEATLLTTVVSVDPIYASFAADEQTFLRYGDRVRQHGKGRRGDLPIQMALADEQSFPHEGTLQFLDNQLDPVDRHDQRARHLPQSRSPPDAGPVRPAPPPRHGVLSRASSSRIAPSAPTSIAASCSSSAHDQMIESRTVTLGPMIDGLRVVQKGLKAGELVVVNGLQRVRPRGAEVKRRPVVHDGQVRR